MKEPGALNYRGLAPGPGRVATSCCSMGACRFAGTTQRDLRFADWGGELAGFVDVSGRENVIGARVAARFQENLGGAPVPFTERLALGGSETMRGFAAGRLRGDSTFVAELQYRYTVSAYLDAELFSSVGNAFDGHLRDLEPGALLWTSRRLRAKAMR